MKKIYTLVILLLLILSCKNNAEETSQILVEKTIQINTKDAILEDLSKTATIVSLILLKVPTDKPLGTINKVLVTKNNYIVLDKLTSTVNIFDKDGGLLSKIEKKGKGPEEYLSIENISITDPNIINIVDTGMQSIKKYSFDGGFLGSNKIEGWPDDYMEKGSFKYYSIYSSYTNEKDIKYYLNITNGTNIKGYFPYKESIKSSQDNINIFFTDNNGNIFCRPHYDDAIYRLKGDQLTIAYKIDFGKLSFPKEKMLETKSVEDIYKLLKKENYIGNIYNIHITEQWLHFQYTIQNINQSNSFIKNLKTNKIIHYFGSIPTKEGISLTPIASDGHFFYSLLNTWRLPDKIISKINAKYNTKLSKDSNVLVKYTYK